LSQILNATGRSNSPSLPCWCVCVHPRTPLVFYPNFFSESRKEGTYHGPFIDPIFSRAVSLSVLRRFRRMFAPRDSNGFLRQRPSPDPNSVALVSFPLRCLGKTVWEVNHCPAFLPWRQLTSLLQAKCVPIFFVQTSQSNFDLGRAGLARPQLTAIWFVSFTAFDPRAALA